MSIIIDSNVLFSALIKDSLTRKIILEYEGLFLFPEIIFEETQEHINELMEKSGLGSFEFNQLFHLILKKVKIVPTDSLKPYREKALEIVKEIDPDDVLFIACALANPGSAIWSNDKKLKKQTKIRILDTSEILQRLMQKEKSGQE